MAVDYTCDYCGNDNAEQFDRFGNPAFSFMEEYHLCPDCAHEWLKVRKSEPKSRTKEAEDEFTKWRWDSPY